MAIGVAQAAGYDFGSSGTYNTWNPQSGSTFIGWIYFNNTSGFHCAWALDRAAGSGLMFESNGTAFAANDNDGSGNLTATLTISANTWYYIAVVTPSGGVTVMYSATEGATSLTTHANANTMSGTLTSLELSVGHTNGFGDRHNGHVLGLKIWSTDLSIDEAWAERFSIAPKRLQNLESFHPLMTPTGQQYRRDLGGGDFTFTDPTTEPSEETNPKGLVWSQIAAGMYSPAALAAPSVVSLGVHNASIISTREIIGY
jgi:hypothetical protein